MGTNASVLSYEMNKINVDERWREQVEAQKAEIAELRAQLARCVRGLGTYRKCFEDGFASKILDELPSKAKADAEVLRCAENIYENHKLLNVHDENFDCALCNAVRAAREVSDA